jgi:hypothetical protein
MIPIPVLYENETTEALREAGVVFSVDKFDVRTGYFDKVDGIFERVCPVTGVEYSMVLALGGSYLSSLPAYEVNAIVEKYKSITYSLN